MISSMQPASTEKPAAKSASWPALCVWLGFLAAGYAYVAGFLCQRDHPFHSGNPGIRDFTLVLLLGPVLFMLGPRHNWNPHRFSALAILKWNGMCYLLPFFLTLHWEFLGHAIGAQFSLKAADLAALDRRSGGALAVGVTTITGLLVSHLAWARRAKILYPYATLLCGIPCLIGIITLLLGDGYYLHVHHYCLGTLLFPFFRFRNQFSLTAQAVFTGLAVEGISRWGMDPMWYASVP